VLDRLEAPERATELLADLHVVDGHLQQPLARAERIRGDEHRGRVGEPLNLWRVRADNVGGRDAYFRQHGVVPAPGFIESPP